MTVGSMFSGYGGLDLAVGGQMLWYAEIDKAACTVLSAHYPEVPNLGDVTQIKWETVAAVDVLTAGYPCQPFSQAGKRKGSKDERHLWPHVAHALSALRPRLVVLENVAGHLSLGFADVLGDLARLGYDAQWGIVRASDAGAPHQRKRLFIVAYACGKRHGSRQGPASLADLGESAEGRRWTPSATWQESGTGSAETAVDSTNWGRYEPAIRRWESLTRPAPLPTIEHQGRPRLNPQFVEWMMGLPEGWVTGHGLKPSQELKMLGNGVVPQQALLALRLLS